MQQGMVLTNTLSVGLSMRPSKYKKEFDDGIIAHMEKGLSFETYAAIISVHRDTLYQWVKDYPEFSDAVKIAKAKCELFWEQLGLNYITHTDSKFESTPKINSAIYIFNMKNRFGWKDRQDVTADVKINSKELEEMSDDELLDLSKRALEAFKSK